MAAERDSWDRWKRGWQHAFFGLLLTVQFTRPDVLSTGAVGEVALRLALLITVVGWYGYWYGPRAAPAGRAGILWYLAGAIGLWLALVVTHSGLWLTGFAVLVPLLMRYAAPAAIMVATCGGLWLAARAGETTLTWPEITASVLTIGAGIMFLGYLSALDREGTKRARLLDELAATQAELAAAERNAGTLAERQRLAREVHDTLTQGFASIVMLLEAVQERRNGDNSEIDRHIASALHTARDNLTESRRLVLALQPSSLDNSALPDAVRQQTDRLADETGIAATTQVTGDPAPLAAPVEAGVLRVVQEALTNARRHAHAAAVTVALSYLPDVLLVDIQDNGTGLPSGERSTGIGLRVMRQRANELGGTLTVESDPGEGTTVALAVPTRVAESLGAGT